MEIVILAAVADNGVIGNEGVLPWRLSTDLRRFKSETRGKVVIMGRKTFQSIGKPLPERTNIVVTRDRGFQPEGVEIVYSLGDAFALASARARCLAGAGEVCVIGGGQVYAEALPLADRLKITHVLGTFAGDATFPEIDPAIWQQITVDDVPAGEKDSHATKYAVYERRLSTQ